MSISGTIQEQGSDKTKAKKSRSPLAHAVFSVSWILQGEQLSSAVTSCRDTSASSQAWKQWSQMDMN